MRQYYIAILAQHAGKYWATVPDLLGVVSVGATPQEALEVVVELADSYVADLAKDGHSIPKARPFDQIEPQDGEIARALIPVTIFEDKEASD